ncbi:SDR family NAD(P)-dependent oxidoreductase [Salibacterium halotolerans]|nr:SDR family NAD(P)-dependent oxidoreductase [Salibacterium halotolerans]
MAERDASLGADIVVNYTNNKASAKMTVSNIQKYGIKALLIQADISKLGKIRIMFATTLKELEKMDIIVANAVVEVVNLPAIDMIEEDYDRLFTINTKGAFFTIQEAANTWG